MITATAVSLSGLVSFVIYKLLEMACQPDILRQYCTVVEHLRKSSSNLSLSTTPINVIILNKSCQKIRPFLRNHFFSKTYS